MLDIVIRGATVFDGTGEEPFRADIGIKESRIARVGTTDGGRNEIHAESLAIAPGFIDVHTHDDVAVVDYPEIPFKVCGGGNHLYRGQLRDGMRPTP